MKYWSNIFAMAGAACIAVAFVDGSIYSFGCGVFMSFIGYKLWRTR